MIIQVTTDEFGNFSIPPIMAAVVKGGFGQMLYFVSEDLLREAIGRTPIETGLLRASGSVSLDGMPLIEYFSASRAPAGGFGQKTKKGETKKGAQYFAPSLKMGGEAVAEYVSRLSLSGINMFVFSVGFNTPYACVIHEGVYRLGRRSVKATARRKAHPVWEHSNNGFKQQYGKVGPRYLSRAWSDNEAKYLTYLRSFGGGTVKVS
jgi:hypothetical protein